MKYQTYIIYISCTFWIYITKTLKDILNLVLIIKSNQFTLKKKPINLNFLINILDHQTDNISISFDSQI
jgi:hypothetical protein